MKLQAHTRHYLEDELRGLGPITHVRINVYPDGGVSRLRVFGSLDVDARRGLGVRRLDTLTPNDARKAFRACAASEKWVEAMARARPFAVPQKLFDQALAAWRALGAADFREASTAHPRIGEREAARDREVTERSWSSGEQAGMASADDAVRAEMRELNAAYEARFGFVYIVCASGRPAEDLLATLRTRVARTHEEEVSAMGEELFKIATLRLEKCIEP